MNKISLSFILLFFFIDNFAQSSEEERLAIQFFQLREYDKAEVLLQKQFDLKPTKFYDYLYKTYIQQRKYKEAIDVTRKMVKSNDKNIEYRYNLGLVYEKSRDTVLSKKEWQYINDQLKDNEYEVNNYLQRYIEARHWSMAEDLILKYQAKTKNKEDFT
jgi:tetratricopeptide (TPR) repeat protein